MVAKSAALDDGASVAEAAAACDVDRKEKGDNDDADKSSIATRDTAHDNKDDNENGGGDDEHEASSSGEEEEEEEEGTSQPSRKVKSIEAAARRALFAAVEEEGGGSSVRPIVRLFYRPEPEDYLPCIGNVDDEEESDGADTDVVRTAKEQREVLLDALRSKSFHKGHARRFFSTLSDLLAKVTEDESYVPASAYENDDEDEVGSEERDLCSVGSEGSRGAKQPPQPSAKASRPSDIVPDEESTEALLFLRACALSVDAYLDGLVDRAADVSESATASAGGGNGRRTKKARSVLDEAFAVAELLHDTLFSLHSCGAEAHRIQSSVASLCERWWRDDFEDKECLVTQLVPFLVVKSLDASAKASDVKRLFHLRSALDLLDFDDEGSIAYLRSLLLRTVSSPLFLRNVDGRRFVAHLFTLHSSLVPDLHRAVKVQIPDARLSILQAYGDVYLRAWKLLTEAEEASKTEGGDDGDDEPSSPSSVRPCLEESALQDLMHAALHVASTPMAKSLRTVLEPFHDAKKTPEIDALLHRLYGPLLFRACASANPLVRVRASLILVATFPLRDPHASPAETETFVQRGIKALSDLLKDDDPRVRCAGSDAAARVLASFWDALPSKDIRSLLNGVIARHASDASSSAVRAAAVQAVTLLLEAPQSHAVLRPLLPSLGNLLHDRVERVRLAVVKMLLRIKKIRGIKYYHVVPVDHLLARLAAEGADGSGRRGPAGGPVASALTGLILNSYFPRGPDVTGSDQIRRTLSFLSSNPDAAIVFYRNMSSHLGVNSVSKLAAMLLKCLAASVDAEKKEHEAGSASSLGAGKKRRRSSTAENDDSRSNGGDGDGDSSGTLNASNTKLMSSIAEVISVLWDSIESSLNEPENEASHEFLLKAFSGAVLTDVHRHFETKANKMSAEDESQARNECYRTCAAVLRCAGKMPLREVKGLSSHISADLAAVRDMDSEDRSTTNLSPHLALLCVWGLTEDVATSLANSIKSEFSVNDVPAEDSLKIISGDIKSSNSSSKSNKRKQGSIRERSSIDSSLVPTLPADVALRVLGNILRGPDPSCVAARGAILTSVTACSVLEDALEEATVYADRILRPTDENRAASEADATSVLIACECFGRLFLHKEATKEGTLQLSPQGRTLLTWITERVTPVLTVKKLEGQSPLGELNLSRISAMGSSAGSPAPPLSPLPIEPPRRRSNRNKTPQKLDASFESMGRESGLPFMSHIYEEAPASHYSHIAAVSLIKAALTIFAEWLAVGGTGGAEIATRVSHWCQVLRYENERIRVRKELLPAFCRITLQLIKGGNAPAGAAILKEILTLCDGHVIDTEEESIIKKVFTASLSSKNSVQQTNDIINAVFDSAMAAFEEEIENGEEKQDELPQSVSELLPDSKESTTIALSCIFSNATGSMAIAKRISASLDNKSNQERNRLFEANCLRLLCEYAPKSSIAEIKHIIRSVDVAVAEEEVELNRAITEMKATV